MMNVIDDILFSDKISRTAVTVVSKKLLLVLLVTGVLCNTSCRKPETKFIATTVENYYLIQNVPDEKIALHRAIADLIDKKRKQDESIPYQYFYRYSSGTAYFVNHKPDPGGHFSEGFDFQEQDKIATFGMERCPTDTTRRLGLLRYFNNWGNYYTPDTLLNDCKPTSNTK